MTDYSPRNHAEQTFYNSMDKIYRFIEEIYRAYGMMRFRGATFMETPPEDTKELHVESIAHHMWTAQLMWNVTHPELPSLSSLVNTYLVSTFLMIHDIGEIKDGDISAVLQINGFGKNREERERFVFEEITSLLPKNASSSLLSLHTRYEREKNNPETQDKETLLAKIFDMLQGDHFVLTRSINFIKGSDMHSKIISTKLIPYVKRLTTVLTTEGHLKAVSETELLIRHHLYQYQRKGTIIEY